MQLFEAKAGEQFYMELWARRSATFVGGDTGGPRLRLVRGNGASPGTTIGNVYFRASDIPTADTWTKLSATVTIPAETGLSQIYFAIAGLPANAAGTVWVDDIVVRRVIPSDQLANNAVTAGKIATGAVGSTQIAAGAVTATAVTDGSLPQAKVAGLPTTITVESTLIDHAADIEDLKAAREVTVNQGRTITVNFTTQANSSSLPTTGNQTWSTQYLTGSGPTFGINGGKAMWVGTLTNRTARVLYRGAASRQVFVNGTAGTFTLTVGANTTAALAWNASAATVQTALTGLASVGTGNATVTGTITTTPGLTIALGGGVSGALSITSSVTGGTATLSDGGETTLTDYQSLRGVLADAPSLLGNVNSAFTALARVSQAGAGCVYARAYWAGLGNLRGEIGWVTDAGVETVWQTNIPLTWSTAMTFRLGVDGNPRAYQVFSGSILVTQYFEGYENLAAFPTAPTFSADGGVGTGTLVGRTGRIFVANDTGLRYTWNGTAYVSSATAASGLGASNRRFGAEVRVNSNQTSGTISSVAVSDNPPVVYKGSLARMERAGTGAVSFPTADTGLPNNFFDGVAYESLDIDANLVTGIMTVTKSGMYMVTARIRLNAYVESVCSVNLQVAPVGGGWSTVQRGSAVWPNDAGYIGGMPGGAAGLSLNGTWLQYLNAGDLVRLSTVRTTGSSSVLTGASGGTETYFSIAAITQ